MYLVRFQSSDVFDRDVLYGICFEYFAHKIKHWDDIKGLRYLVRIAKWNLAYMLMLVRYFLFQHTHRFENTFTG